MAKFTIIKTFKDVKFSEESKPLVICDIDHTFLRCSFDIDHFRNILKSADDDDEPCSFDIILNNPSSDKEAYDLMNKAYNIGFMKQTDPEGFTEMLQNIERLGGKLIFLTARHINYHDKTTKDLIKSGFLNPEKYDIHYTNSEMSKGEYIKKTNLINGYDHISFIDDFPSFLESVYTLHPQINCYLFRY